MHLIYSFYLAPEQPPPPPPTLDDLDVTRHREITSKAVSAILLLTLKWFKASRKYPADSYPIIYGSCIWQMR